MLDVDIKSMVFHSSDGGSLEALRDLHFHCGANSFTSIVGPSGCGKTTTLRCILGLETGYKGEIRISGRPVTASPGKVAAVFQEPRILPWRTVEKNVRLALAKADENNDLDTLFSELGLSEHRSFYPSELSLGLARRVSLARAFAVKPELLILDEPFVSLDEETAGRLRSLLRRVWEAHSCTALMVTHNLREAIELSDRILFYSHAPSRVITCYEIPGLREKRDRDFIDSVRDEIEALDIVSV
ncbi:ABC transporter ATP-binding protein [Chromatiales bacterium (ex Bugula neritina AB1)]|nr:ABC transporter ATP-binding protein [Chromatiales bacterium (ex Bugula neritina AB1)]